MGTQEKTQCKAVILSAPVIFNEGSYDVRAVGLEEARAWIRQRRPVNYSGHATVRLLGCVSAACRETCTDYDEALAIRTKRRLAFGREYTPAEIEAVGFELLLITRRASPRALRQTSPQGTSADVRRDDSRQDGI